MKTLHITVENKVAKFDKEDGVIVCGNNDYQIQFTFDEEWETRSQKVARFFYNGKYEEAEITGNVCFVPVIEKTCAVEVGVYVKDEAATTTAQIPCVPSVLCKTATYKPKGGNSEPEGGYTVAFHFADSHYNALRASRTKPNDINDYDLELRTDEQNSEVSGELINVKELYLWMDVEDGIDTVISMNGTILVSGSGDPASFDNVNNNIVHINQDCTITVTNSY